VSVFGDPVPDIQIELYKSDGYVAGDLARSTQTDAQGQFTFGSVSDDCYSVKFIAPEGIAFDGISAVKHQVVCKYTIRGINQDGAEAFSYGVGEKLDYLNLVRLPLSNLQRLEVIESGRVIHVVDLSPAALQAAATQGAAQWSATQYASPNEPLMGIQLNRDPVLGRDVDINWASHYPADLLSAVQLGQHKAWVLQHFIPQSSSAGDRLEIRLPENRFNGWDKVFPGDGSFAIDATSVGLGSERLSYNVRDALGRKLWSLIRTKDDGSVIIRIDTRYAEFPLTGEIVLVAGNTPFLDPMPSANQLNSELPLQPGSGKVLDEELMRVPNTADLHYFNYAVTGKVAVNTARGVATPLSGALGSNVGQGAGVVSRIVIGVNVIVGGLILYDTMRDWNEVKEKEVELTAWRIYHDIRNEDRLGPAVDPELVKYPEARKMAEFCVHTWFNAGGNTGPGGVPEGDEYFGRSPCSLLPMFVPTSTDYPQAVPFRSAAISEIRPRWLVEGRSGAARINGWYRDKKEIRFSNLKPPIQIGSDRYEFHWGCLRDKKPTSVAVDCDEFPEQQLLGGYPTARVTPAVQWMIRFENRSIGPKLNNFLDRCGIEKDSSARFVYLPLANPTNVDFPLPGTFNVCTYEGFNGTP
jgi:hypothetical protein